MRGRRAETGTGMCCLMKMAWEKRKMRIVAVDEMRVDEVTMLMVIEVVHAFDLV